MRVEQNTDEMVSVVLAQAEEVIRVAYGETAETRPSGSALMTRRSQVKILPPLPRKAPSQAWLYFWEVAIQSALARKLPTKLPAKTVWSRHILDTLAPVAM